VILTLLLLFERVLTAADYSRTDAQLIKSSRRSMTVFTLAAESLIHNPFLAVLHEYSNQAPHRVAWLQTLTTLIQCPGPS